MKLTDKIGYITFWISLAAVVVFLLLFPSFVFFPGLIRKIVADNGLNPYNITIWLIFFGAAVNWFYCIWFLLRYDRYSFSIVPLFLLGILYSPVYFYRVIIKKRPLRNSINRADGDVQPGNITRDEDLAMLNDK